MIWPGVIVIVTTAGHAASSSRVTHSHDATTLLVGSVAPAPGPVSWDMGHLSGTRACSHETRMPRVPKDSANIQCLRRGERRMRWGGGKEGWGFIMAVFMAVPWKCTIWLAIAFNKKKLFSDSTWADSFPLLSYKPSAPESLHAHAC